MSGKWAKGQSGNPFGRPKGATTMEAVRAFRKYEADIFTAFQSLLTDEDGKVRAKGVELGLAYLYGKPAEALPPASDQMVPLSYSASDQMVPLSYSPAQLEAAEAQLGNGESTAPSEAAATDTGGGPREA